MALEDVVELHAGYRAGIVSGRLEYSLVRTVPPSRLPEFRAGNNDWIMAQIERVRQTDLPEDAVEANVAIWERQLASAEEVGTAAYLVANGTFSCCLVFDDVLGLRLLRTEDTRDLDALCAAYSLGDEGRKRLPQTRLEAAHGDDGVVYDSGQNAAVVTLREGGGTGIDHEVLQLGLVAAELVAEFPLWRCSRASEDEMVYEAEHENRRAELALSANRGYRVTRYSQDVGGAPRVLVTCQYQDCEGGVFPAKVRKIVFDAAGQEARSEEYTFTRVELNVPIARAEFEFELPPGAVVGAIRVTDSGVESVWQGQTPKSTCWPDVLDEIDPTWAGSDAAVAE